MWQSGREGGGGGEGEGHAGSTGQQLQVVCIALSPYLCMYKHIHTVFRKVTSGNILQTPNSNVLGHMHTHTHTRAHTHTSNL